MRSESAAYTDIEKMWNFAFKINKKQYFLFIVRRRKSYRNNGSVKPSFQVKHYFKLVNHQNQNL